MWVKGSGGDLGTLTEAGLAVLRLDRLRALVGVYAGEEREDEMVAAFDFCLHGKGGAAPSIDTAMHGLVEAAHVDHLHPDAGIALATAVDGEALTTSLLRRARPVGALARPGFQLGLDISAVAAEHPEAIGVILGGHGITAWGETSDECEARSLEIIRAAQAYIEANGRPEPFGPGPGEHAARPRRSAMLGPRRSSPCCGDWRAPTPARSATTTTARSCSTSWPGSGMPALARRGLPARTTSCAPRSGRWCSTCRQRPRSRRSSSGCVRAARGVSGRLPGLLRAIRSRNSPPMRGADPAIVLVPGVGMFSFGRDKQTARVAGEFYVNAINVMRGAEAISVYEPILESEKFRIEYWELEEQKLRRQSAPKALADADRLRHRRRLWYRGGDGAASRFRGRLRRLSRTSTSRRPQLLRARSVDETWQYRAESTWARRTRWLKQSQFGVLAFGGVDLVVNNAGMSISKSLIETTVDDWDRQHEVMARGSFLVSREAARVMGPQAMGGDIVYIVSKNAVFAGPNNVAYGSTKADQAHQVRLLAAELGQYGIRVNGVNPDGVVRGSGIFASGWGAQRAAVYGVPEEKLGEYYASRTLLKLEVLPEHVANAVFVLTSAELSHTTGLLIPVDAGVAAAFLR